MRLHCSLLHCEHSRLVEGTRRRRNNLQHKYNLLIYHNKRRRCTYNHSKLSSWNWTSLCYMSGTAVFAHSRQGDCGHCSWSLSLISSYQVASSILSVPTECTKHIRPKPNVCRNCAFLHILCRNGNRNSVDLYPRESILVSNNNFERKKTGIFRTVSSVSLCCTE